MSKTKYYRQCKLIRHMGESKIEQVSFIPEEYAKVGSILKLKDMNGDWVDGWNIETAGEKMDAAIVEAHARTWMHTRKHSDI